MNINNNIKLNTKYTFTFSTPYLNPIINESKLLNYLNNESEGYFHVNNISVFGDISVEVEFYKIDSIINYGNWLAFLISEELYGTSYFKDVTEGSNSYLDTVSTDIQSFGLKAVAIIAFMYFVIKKI